MSASYQIPITGDTTDIDRQVDRAIDKIDHLADRASSVEIGSPRSGGRTSGGGGAGGLLPDPWTRAADLRTELAAARGLGLTEDTVRPLALASAKADGAAARADRVLAGHGGDVAGLASRGMLGLGLVGGAAGIAAFYANGIGAGMTSMNDITGAYWAGGGSMANTSAVAGVGRFLGRDASDSAGAAVRFGGALHGSTYGAGYMRSRGIVDFGGLQTDKTENYVRGVRELLNEPDRGQATRVAHDLGLDDELTMRDLPTRLKSRALSGMGDQMSKHDREEMARIKLMQAETGSAIAQGWRGFVSLTVGNVAELVDMPGRAGDAGEYQGRLRAAQKYAAEHGLPFNKADFDAGTDESGRALSGRAHARAMGFKGDELNRFPARPGMPGTPEYTGARNGEDRPANGSAAPGLDVRTTAGNSGGPRAQSAVPIHVRGQQLDQNLRGYGNWLGGYVP